MTVIKPSPPWNLSCPWCAFYIVVNARGARGRDGGSGIAAADEMKQHLEETHPDRSWHEFLGETVISAA